MHVEHIFQFCIDDLVNSCIKLQLSTYEPKELVLNVLPVTVSTVFISSFFLVSFCTSSSCLGRITVTLVTTTDEVWQICT